MPLRLSVLHILKGDSRHDDSARYFGNRSHNIRLSTGAYQSPKKWSTQNQFVELDPWSGSRDRTSSPGMIWDLTIYRTRRVRVLICRHYATRGAGLNLKPCMSRILNLLVKFHIRDEISLPSWTCILVWITTRGSIIDLDDTPTNSTLNRPDTREMEVGTNVGPDASSWSMGWNDWREVTCKVFKVVPRMLCAMRSDPLDEYTRPPWEMESMQNVP
ncbi:hypothetical protein DFP72DRAFT_1046241 [Ephemerocybe angulata]|uniref:Uncharacterized protein n=1 Tax=Ephemerocybe angulata TaxID=980116 RepID=A0A8H6HX88_9AGAR|nr:hypothetical protein DFP72DRAFT_1046241 [Tulosesus angulatus]